MSEVLPFSRRAKRSRFNKVADAALPVACLLASYQRGLSWSPSIRLELGETLFHVGGYFAQKWMHTPFRGYPGAHSREAA